MVKTLPNRNRLALKDGSILENSKERGRRDLVPIEAVQQNEEVNEKTGERSIPRPNGGSIFDNLKRLEEEIK